MSNRKCEGIHRLVLAFALFFLLFGVSTLGANATEDANCYYNLGTVYPQSGAVIFDDKKSLYDTIVFNMRRKGIYIEASDIVSVKSSNPDIIKIDSKYKVTAQDAGAAYIIIKIKETELYKEFVAKRYYIVYPPTCGGWFYSPMNMFDNEKRIKNTLKFGYSVGDLKVGKKTRSRLEIATDKSFKNIVKTYDLSPKWFNNLKCVQIKNIKKYGLKKNKTYCVRAYSYKEHNGTIIKSKAYQWDKFKITNDWTVKTIPTLFVRMGGFDNNSGQQFDEMMCNAYGISMDEFDEELFNELYKK